MNLEELKPYALYFAIAIPILILVIRFFVRIPKFNPTHQYDLDIPFSKILKLILQGIIAFVIGFGGVILALYLLLSWIK